MSQATARDEHSHIIPPTILPVPPQQVSLPLFSPSDKVVETLVNRKLTNLTKKHFLGVTSTRTHFHFHCVTEVPFAPILSAIVKKALFDPDGRALERNNKNAWNVPFAVWNITDRVEQAKGKAPITFYPMESANHVFCVEISVLFCGPDL
ncbi:hypothetical protein C8F04DRAFT_1257225 [Mycena alexandri]|uniref:Uncharacterized protein n=1 Tax=Mycena alexandri TaxID=1745969 RepID=A0AAD6T3T4_9AGAR|nr:hypothetical protein C8F04DRAFT_1257225 [Mycena alexandri]